MRWLSRQAGSKRLNYHSPQAAICKSDTASLASDGAKLDALLTCRDLHDSQLRCYRSQRRSLGPLEEASGEENRWRSSA